MESNRILLNPLRSIPVIPPKGDRKKQRLCLAQSPLSLRNVVKRSMSLPSPKNKRLPLCQSLEAKTHTSIKELSTRHQITKFETYIYNFNLWHKHHNSIHLFLNLKTFLICLFLLSMTIVVVEESYLIWARLINPKRHENLMAELDAIERCAIEEGPPIHSRTLHGNGVPLG